jgi:hypothetical protein
MTCNLLRMGALILFDHTTAPQPVLTSYKLLEIERHSYISLENIIEISILLAIS